MSAKKTPKGKSPWTQAKKDAVKQKFEGWLNVFRVLPSAIIYDWQDLNNKDDDESGSVYFEVRSQFPYRSIRLTCYPAAADVDGETLTRFLLHEAIHVVLAPLTESRYEPWNTFRTFGEFVTEHITHYIWACRLQDDDKDAKIAALEKEIARLKRRR